MKQSHTHQSSGSTVKTKMKKGVMLTRQCAVPAVLQSHSFHGLGAWAWLSWPLYLRSRRTAVTVSARLCSHIGARLGKYMLSNHPHLCGHKVHLRVDFLLLSCLQDPGFLLTVGAGLEAFPQLLEVALSSPRPFAAPLPQLAFPRWQQDSRASHI